MATFTDSDEGLDVDGDMSIESLGSPSAATEKHGRAEDAAADTAGVEHARTSTDSAAFGSSRSSRGALASMGLSSKFGSPGVQARPSATSASLHARISALSTHGNRTGSPARPSPSPVQSRIEQLSSRIAMRAQQVAQDQRNRESAIVDLVRNLEQRLDHSQQTISSLTRTVSELQEKISDERRARQSLERSYDEKVGTLSDRVARLKQQLAARSDEESSSFAARLQQVIVDAQSRRNQMQQLTEAVNLLDTRVATNEKTIPQLNQMVQDAATDIEVYRNVKAETDASLMKLLEDTFSKLRADLAAEKSARERNEEALLNILENSVSASHAE